MVECIITRTPITAVVRIILRRLGATRVHRRRFTHVKYVEKSEYVCMYVYKVSRHARSFAEPDGCEFDVSTRKIYNPTD